MSRSKTQFRHIDSDNKVTRVTKEDDAFYIGDTNERAEGKMMHYNSVQHANNHRPDHAINNPYYGSGNGEWDDYAHTSEDL